MGVQPPTHAEVYDRKAAVDSERIRPRGREHIPFFPGSNSDDKKTGNYKDLDSREDS